MSRSHHAEQLGAFDAQRIGEYPGMHEVVDRHEQGVIVALEENGEVNPVREGHGAGRKAGRLRGPIKTRHHLVAILEVDVEVPRLRTVA